MTSSNNKSVKTLKLNNNHPSDTNTNSTSSATLLHVRHSTSKSLSQNDEDEFYDAVDAVDGLNSACSIKNGNSKFTYEDDDVVEEEEDNDNDNDRTFVFFDTATSRHASEMSTNESLINGNKSATPSRTKSIGLEENSIREEKRVITSQNDQNHETKLSNKTTEEDDDDDEADAELETAWSFWIDKCVKGASKQDYEASIKLIHTVKTVQVLKYDYILYLFKYFKNILKFNLIILIIM